MSVQLLDSTTIIDFVQDEEAFCASVRERFAHLDVDGDGVLSYEEMMKEMQSLRVRECDFGVDVKPEPEELASLYGAVFGLFDQDSNGEVDFDEFLDGTKKMMLAIAEGVGFLPIHMALEEDSFLMKAVLREAAKVVA